MSRSLADRVAVQITRLFVCAAVVAAATAIAAIRSGVDGLTNGGQRIVMAVG